MKNDYYGTHNLERQRKLNFRSSVADMKIFKGTLSIFLDQHTICTKKTAGSGFLRNVGNLLQ